MAIERPPRNSAAPPAAIPRPIVEAAPGTGNKPTLVRVIGHRVVNNQALAIVPAGAQSEAAEPAIAAGAEAYQAPDPDPPAASFGVGPCGLTAAHLAPCAREPV